LRVIAFFVLGAERLSAIPFVSQYLGHGKILVIAVLAAPLLAAFTMRRRRMLAWEESIRISERQLPEVHEVLVRHCRRIGVPLPDLYLSDGVEHTTSFSWRHRNTIVVSTHDFDRWPDAFDDVIDFAIAREVGSICLGHTSFGSELLKWSVAPFPFLRTPLHTIRTYSCDRYGAFLAPRAIRAVIVAASGDRLRNRVDLDAYLAQLDEESETGWWASLIRLFIKRVPLAYRVQELRRAGLLTKC
jgi:hypothetical protein